MRGECEVIFLFIGGPHQVPHVAPVAAEPSQLRRDLDVTCLYFGDATAEMLETVCRTYRRGNPLYAGWHLGEVAEDLDEIFPAIDRAIDQRPDHVPAQRKPVDHAFGDYWDAVPCGAAIIAAAVSAPSLPRIRRIAVS